MGGWLSFGWNASVAQSPPRMYNVYNIYNPNENYNHSNHHNPRKIHVRSVKLYNVSNKPTRALETIYEQDGNNETTPLLRDESAIYYKTDLEAIPTISKIEYYRTSSLPIQIPVKK